MPLKGFILIQWWKWPVFTGGTLVGDVFYILKHAENPVSRLLRG